MEKEIVKQTILEFLPLLRGWILIPPPYKYDELDDLITKAMIDFFQQKNIEVIATTLTTLNKK